jgi:hypothetical protein
VPEIPYTTKDFVQYRGPQISEEYNSRLENNYRDLVYLYNKQNQTDSDIKHGFSAFVKDLESLTDFINYLTMRIEMLESNSNVLTFNNDSQIDTNYFNGTAFEISEVDRCTFNMVNSAVTLPRVDASSISKIKFNNTDGTYNIAPSLELLALGVNGTADDNNNIVDTSQPLNAVLGRPGKVWERNVLVPMTSSPDLSDGAQMYFYIAIPTELSVTELTNCISFTPFPLKSIDVLEISYTTANSPSLSESTLWTPFNKDKIYFNSTSAVGNVMPGGWSGDEILDSSSKLFYFDPLPITAIRFKLRQKNYYNDGSKYIYTYGMSKLDVRFDKFLDTGKTIIRLDAPEGVTISDITSVTPQIWNVPEYFVDNVFEYRVIWEDGDSFTTTNVPFSARVWIEVTLSKTPDGGTPMLSGLIANYTSGI